MRLSLATLAVVATLSVPSTAAAAGLPAVPIPSDPRDALVVKTTGTEVAPRPLGDQPVPRHPFMAANGASNIHDDAYQTDAYEGPGPLGPDLSVRSTLFAAECASVTFDSRGRIVTVCVSPTGATLRMLDPDSLATLASHELPLRKLGSFSFSNFAGGGYFYLDQLDRAVVTTFTGHLQVYAETSGPLGPGFRRVRDVDLNSATAGADILSALPDWSGRIWFVTSSGVVGFVAADDTVHAVRLPDGETVANSFAVDESGGVFVVSTHALYRLDAAGDAPTVSWRQPYDRGTRVKPGQVSQGSGTTPTLIGAASSRGGGAIAITDNAEPRMNVLVFRRGRSGPGAEPLCRQPVFPAGESADENSLIAVPGGLIAENNNGYAGPLAGVPGRTADTTPGLARVDVDYEHGGCHLAWENTTARIPTLVSKVSLATGLVYGYTHPAADELPMTLRLSLPLADLLAPDAWFLTAFDARTGAQVWSRFVGNGLGYNNNYAPVTLRPDGTAYVGTLGGLVRVGSTG
jgi:outer membrane protein assembly factor BamB